MKHNKTLFFACAAALTLMASCSKEELSTMRFHATIDNNDAKCAYNGTNVVWNNNETITIFSSYATNGETWRASTITTNGQGAEFVHEGPSVMEGHNDVTCYAVSNVMSGSLSGETLNVTINPNVNASNPIAFMAAKTTNNTLHFQHLGGMLALTYAEQYNPTGQYKSYQLNSVTISSTSHQLAGSHQINFDATTGTPSFATTTNGSTSLTYTTDQKSGTIYFPLVPGTYSNFTISFNITRFKNKDNTGASHTVTRSLNSGNFTIEAGKVYTLSL